MLIICSGPDTYHARKKARDLVAAFREKHDPAGYSTDILNDVDIDAVLNRLGSPSLFAQKRFIRCDGLLASLKIADIRKLAKRLETDHDQTILLTVEDESIASKTEKEFEGVKIVSYPHPLLSGRAFEDAVIALAIQRGVHVDRARKLAHETNGDMWLADQELQKYAANLDYQFSSTNSGSSASFFELADSFLRGSSAWRTRLDSSDELDGAVSVFPGQARSFARVMSGQTDGIPVFIIKKMQQLRSSRTIPVKTILQTAALLYATRTGLSSAKEALQILQ
jgi:hypothetical protein